MATSPTLLILTDWFAPGYKAGGPIRSCVNLAHAMKDDFQVYVLTTDTDFGASAPYPDIAPEQWLLFDPRIQVKYLSAKRVSRKQIREEIRALSPDLVYLNSMFSLNFTIWPLLMKRANQISGRIMLAPRGMLHAGAIQYKPFKKKLFINLLRLIGIHKRIHFQATDEQEEKDIKGFFGPKASASVVANLPTLNVPLNGHISKKPGEAKFVYVSRIGPKKNLLFFLERLPQIKGRVELDIIGPMEDTAYWDKCQHVIEQLPSGISVKLVGEMPHHAILKTLGTYHFFVLPTWGENFGHAVFEALLAGKPVLISDQTPWRGLFARKAGWDLSLDNPSAFVEATQAAIEMDQDTYDTWSQAALDYARNFIEKSRLTEKYKVLFTQQL